jgi:Uma2 family endonuclease
VNWAALRGIVPDLVVEIVNPSNLAEEIDRKIPDSFQAQVRLVWVLYPDFGRLYVYQLPIHVRILRRTDTLDGGEVLPGFYRPIASVYEGVTKPA